MLFSFGNFAYFFYISKLCKESVRVCTILPGCLTNMKCRTILHARSTFLLQTHETIFSMCQIFGPAHVRMCDRYTFNLSISGMLLNWSIFEIVKSNCFFLCWTPSGSIRIYVNHLMHTLWWYRSHHYSFCSLAHHTQRNVIHEKF